MSKSNFNIKAYQNQSLKICLASAALFKRIELDFGFLNESKNESKNPLPQVTPAPVTELVSQHAPVGQDESIQQGYQEARAYKFIFLCVNIDRDDGAVEGGGGVSFDCSSKEICFSSSHPLLGRRCEPRPEGHEDAKARACAVAKRIRRQVRGAHRLP